MGNILIYFLPLLLFLNINHKPEVGQVIDTYKGVSVYYNGACSNVKGRNVTEDGYNLGLKWQCVEFVKRFYYERYQHKMPNAYGHAKDFFDDELGDIGYNEARGMMQYRNTRKSLPKPDDIIVYGTAKNNSFGHVGIITEVSDDYIELIQQNVGENSRVKLKLIQFRGIYTVADFNIKGWLRLEH